MSSHFLDGAYSDKVTEEAISVSIKSSIALILLLVYAISLASLSSPKDMYPGYKNKE